MKCIVQVFVGILVIPVAWKLNITRCVHDHSLTALIYLTLHSKFGVSLLFDSGLIVL